MRHIRFSCLIMAVLLLAIPFSAFAADMECDEVYCFSSEDFGDPVSGICVLSLPDSSRGTLLLGSRVICEGDILTSQQISAMEFRPLQSEVDQEASMTYLPVFDDHVAPETTMVFSIRGKTDNPPVAEDFAVETYKNLPFEGTLKATDPEGKAMKYTLLRQPKRGTVELREDGSFLYTPKKNKVGIDSFIYTATDPAGKISREATVTIKILRPSDAKQYTDTEGTTCRFTAEWMKNNGIFVGEEVAGQRCFYPNAQVTRGQFLAMTLRAMEIPVEENAIFQVFSQEPAQWVAAPLSAALRCGILNGLPQSDSFGEDIPITGAEAAVILQNILQLSIPEQQQVANVDGITTFEENPLAWAEESMAVMAQNGIDLSGEVLTREQVADILYRAAMLAKEAPALSIFR